MKKEREFPGTKEIKPLLDQVVKITNMQLEQRKYTLYLFGSWARGDAHKGSDIDIAIDAGEKLDDNAFRQVKAFIDAIRTVRTIELVDLNDVSDDFKQNILRDGVIIHK